MEWVRLTKALGRYPMGERGVITKRVEYESKWGSELLEIEIDGVTRWVFPDEIEALPRNA